MRNRKKRKPVSLRVDRVAARFPGVNASLAARSKWCDSMDYARQMDIYRPRNESDETTRVVLLFGAVFAAGAAAMFAALSFIH